MFYNLSEAGAQNLADRISLYVALAPVANISNTEVAGIGLAIKSYGLLENTLETFHIYELLDRNWFTS